MSLQPPVKLRRLQEALGAKAKREPRCRFHALSDKVYRTDILAHAWEVSRAAASASVRQPDRCSG